MKHLLHLLRLAACSCAFLGSQTVASAASAYEQATAGNPGYDNKELWPKLSGKERFLTQKHPEGRVMEWAKPGEGIGGRSKLDAWDPENWLLNGKPATEVKFDENTDLILPPSDKPYHLDMKRVEGWEPVYRHITIGKNASLQHEASRTFGNVWVKEGGTINSRHSNNFLGGHTFLRNDNGSYEDAKSGRIGQYFFVNKESPEASLEIIGYVSVLDRVPITSGTLIIGPDARFSPGRNATMVVSEGATVALLDGARLSKWVNQIGQLDVVVFGTLQGGLPERPLTRPASLELSYQNTTGVKFFDKLPLPAKDVRNLESRLSAMFVGKNGVIRTISSQPDALLHVRWNGIDAADWHMGAHGPAEEWLKGLDSTQTAYLETQLAAIPKKLTTMFQKGAMVDGLVVNDYHKGGFLMENPEDFDSWTNLKMGERNEATGKELIARITRAEVRDSVKNPGGDYELATSAE